MALTYFTVVGQYVSFSGQEFWDAGAAAKPMSGTVIFTPLVTGTIQTSTSHLVLKPVQAVIKAGQITRNDEVGCPLAANTAELNLTGDLYYRVSFFYLRTAEGESVALEEFNFIAPTTAVTVDLTTVAPAPELGP